MRGLIVVLGSVALVLACHGTLTPATGPGTSYPCGIGGVSCGNHACCPENHICGYVGPFARCEPGYCCYDGPDWPGARPDGGAAPHAPVPQKRVE